MRLFGHELFGYDAHHCDDPSVGASPMEIENFHQLAKINQRLDKMVKTLDDLIAQGNATLAQVTKNTDLDQSIIAIVNANAQTISDLRAQLAAAGTDPAKLAQLGDVMDQIATKAVAEGQATADAITANTNAA